MPLPENVKLQVSLNGGAAQVGGITANHGDTVVASLLEPAGVAKARYEIYEYPEGFTVPAGWTHDVDTGVYFFFSANGMAAPPFTLPESTTLWGKWLLSVEVNNRMRAGELADDLFDSTTALSIVSPGGLVDTAFRENQQFGGVRQWAGEIKKNWRTLDAGVGGGVNPADGSLIRIHQEYASTVAHYRMQDTTAEADVLLDSVNAQNITKDGNGNNFPTGTFPGGMNLTKIGGLTFAYLSKCRHDVAATAAYLQGAMTAVFLGSRLISGFSTGGWILYGLAGTNTQYAFDVVNNGTLRYWHHHGAQVVAEHIIRWFPPTDLFWMGFTRSSGGVVQVWMNGKKVGPASSALTMPTGGATAKFHFVNSSAAGVTLMPSWMASCRIDNVVLSDATLKADFNHTLGNAQGYVL